MIRSSRKIMPLVLSLAAVGTMLLGCTGGTEEPPVSPTPSVTQQSTAAPSPKHVPQKPVVLEPGEGETVVLRLLSKDTTVSNQITLGQGETFASLTCVGTGPISVSFSDAVSYTQDCEWFAGHQIMRNSDMTMSGKTLQVNVEAEPGQDWQLLVTQQKQ